MDSGDSSSPFKTCGKRFIEQDPRIGIDRLGGIPLDEIQLHNCLW